MHKLLAQGRDRRIVDAARVHGLDEALRRRLRHAAFVVSDDEDLFNAELVCRNHEASHDAVEGADERVADGLDEFRVAAL